MVNRRNTKLQFQKQNWIGLKSANRKKITPAEITTFTARLRIFPLNVYDIS